MPVSPQDFALWSHYTGNPYPQTPAERMALAPHVYEFSRNINRGQEPGPIRKTIDVIGKGALAAGLLTGAAVLGGKYGQQLWQQKGEGVGTTPLEIDAEPEIRATPTTGAGGPFSQVVQTSGDITHQSPAEHLDQGLIPEQTATLQRAKGLTATQPTTKPGGEQLAAQSELLSTQQSPVPSGEESVGGGAEERAAAFRKSKVYALRQKQAGLGGEGEELIGGGEPVHVVEEAPAKLIISEEVKPSPTVRVATSSSPATVDVGSALRARGLTLMGDPSDPSSVQLVTPSGHEVYMFHPYATHPKEGIRQTALAEEERAQELLARAGVTREQAVKHFQEKFSTPSESPIAEMARPAVVSRPATTLVTAIKGPSAEEIREIDASLARGLARHTQEQRIDIRNQMLAKKYGAAEAPAEVKTIVTPTQPNPVRVAVEPQEKPTKVKVNEFLSKMSQGSGPLESYEIPSARSSAVREVNLYPGGEIGVALPTKQGAKEYVYGASDPFRLAVGDYASEGFPSEMGHLGKVFGYQGVGPGLGLMTKLTPGGRASSSAGPLYTGLMSESEISSAMNAPKKTVTARRLSERAANDQATREIMAHLERRAAERRASI